MISVENLTKGYGAQQLFDGFSFKINPRERVGLVGRNGHGKTTLLRIITGEEEPDAGAVVIPKNYRIGYVRQHIDFQARTVLEEGIRGLRPEEKDQHWKVEKILMGLGFSLPDLQRDPLEFSGGYQVRLNLAKVLVSEPDLLLLDEPTNYLDITSIRWIERFLREWPHELLLITHDRGFMDQVVTHIVGLHRKRARKIEGTNDKYYAQIAQDEEIFEKTRLNDERKRKEMELFISRFRAKARLANLVQSRVKTLEKMEKTDRLETLKTLDFAFRYADFPGKYILTARELSFAYDTANPLISDFSLTIGARDRICVVGKNGKGKTTLLRLLAGSLKPDQGEITCHPRTVKGVFEQTNIQSLVDARTVEEEILNAAGDLDRQQARSICGAMLFEGDAALKTVRVLSGGEKSRVMLGRVLASPINLLLLDEPTNHLDMESCDALLSALDSFEGAVVIVTHNEMFLHALAERLVVFSSRGAEVFEGGYQRFLDKVGWEEEEPPPATSRPAGGETEKLSRKELRRRRSEIVSERSRVTTPVEKRIQAVEDEIITRENMLGEAARAMQKATRSREASRIAKLSQDIHAHETAIESLFAELEELTAALENHQADFERQLIELEQLQ